MASELSRLIDDELEKVGRQEKDTSGNKESSSFRIKVCVEDLEFLTQSIDQLVSSSRHQGRGLTLSKKAFQLRESRKHGMPAKPKYSKLVTKAKYKHSFQGPEKPPEPTWRNWAWWTRGRLIAAGIAGLLLVLVLLLLVPKSSSSSVSGALLTCQRTPFAHAPSIPSVTLTDNR